MGLELAVYIIIWVLPVSSLHIQGSWATSSSFTVLAKFGFQKTDPLKLDKTRGYIYGNITSSGNFGQKALLVLTNQRFFPDIYRAGAGGVRQGGRNWCGKMLEGISHVAFDRLCFPKGTQDFLRWVPCEAGELCSDEDDPRNVIPDNQLTFRTQDKFSPGFWYLMLLGCSLNSQCNWTEQSGRFTLDYDLWLVNGYPLMKYTNPFEHQFSFDEQDMVEIYFLALAVYSVCGLLQIRALRLVHSPSKRAHFLTGFCLVKTGGIFFNFLHVITYSFDGDGVIVLRWMGDILNIVSVNLLILLIILLARGWTITSLHIKRRNLVVSLWSLVLTLHVILFAWNSKAVDQLEEIDIFETWPGWGILCLRFLTMFWFLVELRNTVQSEFNEDKARFLVHFGSGFLVWFVYLLLLGVVSSQISLLWRFKVILSIDYLADFLAVATLIHLFWPLSTNRKFFIDSEVSTALPQFELDEFEKSLVEEEEVPLDPDP